MSQCCKRSPDVLNGPLSHLKGQKNVLILSAKAILCFFFRTCYFLFSVFSLTEWALVVQILQYIILFLLYIYYYCLTSLFDAVPPASKCSRQSCDIHNFPRLLLSAELRFHNFVVDLECGLSVHSVILFFFFLARKGNLFSALFLNLLEKWFERWAI